MAAILKNEYSHTLTLINYYIISLLLVVLTLTYATFSRSFARKKVTFVYWQR